MTRERYTRHMARTQPPKSTTSARTTSARRTRTPSTDVTEALIAAARELIEEDGEDGLTVRAVATRAGVAPMGVYSRFGGKPGLTEALFVDGFVQLRETVMSASGPDAIARLRTGCLAYRDFAITHPHLYDLMFRRMKSLDLSEASIQTAIDTFGVLAQRVRDAMDAGLLSGGDEVEVAQRLWNGLHGGVLLETAGVVFTEDPAETYAAMMDTFIAGLSPAR